MFSATRIVAASALLAAAGAAGAQTWVEEGPFGGAGPGNREFSPPQIVLGSGPLTTITGSSFNQADVDPYLITISDPSAFSAVADQPTSYVPRLFLIDPDTFEAYSAVQDGTLSGNALPGGGDYILVIVPSIVNAFNESGLAIFDFSTPGVEVAPSAAFGGSIIDNMAFGGFAGFTNQAYTITLTGAEFVVPAPGGVAAIAALGLVGLRRRR